jgi:hypothetical protein
MARHRCVPWCDVGAAVHTGEDGDPQHGLRIRPSVSCGEGCTPAFTIAWLCTGAENVDWKSGLAGNHFQPLRIEDADAPASIQVTATVTVSCAPDGEAAQCSTTWLLSWSPGARFGGITVLDTTCPGT